MTTVAFSRLVFTSETVRVTSTCGGAVVDVPEVAAPSELTVEHGAILRIAAGTPSARIAHITFTLAGPFASLAVATPAAPVLTVGALSGRLTLTSDIAFAVAAMDDSVSVAVSGVFLLTGVASGVNVTRGAVTLLHVDALSGTITANRSLATLTVATTASSASVTIGAVRLDGASSVLAVASRSATVRCRDGRLYICRCWRRLPHHGTA